MVEPNVRPTFGPRVGHEMLPSPTTPLLLQRLADSMLVPCDILTGVPIDLIRG
jgi:hypothetical protein